jgi:hypothetical protein
MTAGQDGFRDASSKQQGSLCKRPLADPDVSRLASIGDAESNMKLGIIQV